MTQPNEGLPPRFDVQLYPSGVAMVLPDDVHDENLPGQVNLSNDDLDTLRDLINEAWLARHGMEAVCVQVQDVKKGDIIPSLGLTVTKAFRITSLEKWVIQFGNNHEHNRCILPGNLEITVHRRIS